MIKFNPKFAEFLKEKKDIKLIGLTWAFYWRLSLIIVGAYLVFLFFLFVLGMFIA